MQDVERIFGTDGALARVLEGYRPRAAQVAMAERVAGALESGSHLAIEAGTGIGKTFAYLAPALFSGRRVVISTGTRTLQDQLFDRDLPLLGRAVGRPVAMARLKGRANYLCRHRLGLALESERAPDRDLARVAAWARTTREADIAELTAVGEQSRVWPRVTSTVENCLGSQCPEYAECAVVAARRRAAESEVVVVNHHLLLADLLLREEGFAQLLPGADAVIVDEAHQLPEVAQQFLGVRLSGRGIDNLARDLRLEARRSGCGGEALEALADRAVYAGRDIAVAVGSGAGRLDWSEVDRRVAPPLSALVEALTALDEALAALTGASAGLDQAARRVGDLRARAERILAGEEEGLRWLERLGTSYALNLTPLDFSERFGRLLEGTGCGWVFTSATLAVDGGFEHFTDRIGLGAIDGEVLPSPFDYAANGLLYLPKALPAPASGEYTAALLEAVLPIIIKCEGRAFVLFTSHRALAEARDWFRLQGEFECLVQGESSKADLLDRFRAGAGTVLLGTASFWEGVDVRGDALRVVVIDRLPFASPGDPLVRARIDAIRRRGGEPFREFQLPQAVIALKQGVGRLIRDERDWGVVVIGDPRLSGKGYGRAFVRSLPPFSRTRELDEVLAFLDRETPRDAALA